MLAALILLAQVAAKTPVATPTPAPVVKADTGQTRTLADVARERKLGKKGVQGGTLSVAGAAGAPALTSGSADKAASEADARLAKAIENGGWVDRNIHYNEDIKQDARNEWDAAAENCRKTPGCTPVYRENMTVNGLKPLRTGDEIQRDLKQKGIWAGRKLRPEDGVSQ